MRNVAAIKVKANAHYTCQECDSTELIQAHHEIPGDDNSLIALCAECHSKRHPNVPKALFFSTNNQPYWHNKPASSLAKELGVHPRTVIRAAKRLEVLPGELSSKGEKQIRQIISITRNHPFESASLVETGQLPIYHCCRCGYNWKARKLDIPTQCPKCRSPYWNIAPEGFQKKELTNGHSRRS